MAGTTTREEILAERYEPINVQSGRAYEIRIVRPADLVRTGLLTLPQLEQAKALQGKVKADQPLDQFELATLDLFIRGIVILGVSSLRLRDRPRADCKENELSIDDFPEEDLLEVFQEISRKSGFLPKEQLDANDVVNPTPRTEDSFREAAGEDSSGGAPAAVTADH